MSVFGPGGVLFTETDGVAVVTLARPDKMNALNQQVSEGLWTAFESMHKDPPRVCILRAEGRMFCAGADTRNLSRGGGPSQRPFAELLHLIHTLPSVVIGVAQGGAYGGGFGLLSCCDIVIAVKSAKFALSEVRLGMIPATISPYVIQKLGASKSQRFFVTGENFSAKDAEKYGLISEVVDSVDDLKPAVQKFLDMLTLCAPKAVAASKRLVQNVIFRPPVPGADLRKYTSSELAQIVRSPEVKEGATAHQQKRKPKWAATPLVAKY
eukprot:TRINITY_DN1727_c2_g2_i1.p1 TRINITY_DN1727_c2_g2~~TRINITY_DN1727_c2_g2_i1.p1  ORF type:complete len:267 (+),score=46.51 TRINITY_DN1727_c2_g2_i1:73-873(+)